MTINHINLSIRWHICAKRNALPLSMYTVYIDLCKYIYTSHQIDILKFAFWEPPPFFFSRRTSPFCTGIIFRYCAVPENRNRLWIGNNKQALALTTLSSFSSPLRILPITHQLWDVDSCVCYFWSCVWFWFLWDSFWLASWRIIGIMSVMTTLIQP